MRFKTLLGIGPVVALFCSGAMAECQGTACKLFSPCQQSMLQGNWEFFLGFQPTDSVCPVTIAASGSFTTASLCVDNYPYVNRPSGTVTIDTSCHVTGSLSFSLFGGNEPDELVTFSTISMWISADGSRVSGYGSGTRSTGNFNSFHGVPLEMVYRTAGQ